MGLTLTRHPGNGGLLHDDQHVQRVAVRGGRAGDEPVVGRVVDRGIEDPVQADRSGGVVEFVLVAAPLRDLDDRLDVR